MGTYAVAFSKTETATIHVEADDAPTAEAVATREAESNWEGDTVNLQVDDVNELVGQAADKVAADVVKEED